MAENSKKQNAKITELPQENSKTYDESAVQRIVLENKLKEKLEKLC